ncbi:MAG: alpha/beta hydrolase domain-containing protein, partial [Acidobacteriota bacterium]
MGFVIRAIRPLAVLAVLPVLAPAPSYAELTRIEIAARVDVLGGKAFGAVGPYEKLRGTAYFAVDPANEHNRIIADLDKAPRNREGKVEFSSDLFILKPKDPSRGNGVVLFDIVNRGRLRLLNQFSRGEATNEPTTEDHFGDASLLNQGYTLVAVGWQFDVADGNGLVGFDPPIATENGKPITGWVRAWFIPTEATSSFEYVTGYNTAAYRPIDPNASHYRLTAREGIISARGLIPREDWQFGQMIEGRIVADPNFITLKSGFEPGMTYEIMYEAQNPPVQGLGLASIRDMASALKYDPDSIAPGRYAYMYGSSQTGRLIRKIIHEGFTIDEEGRKVFDAAFVNTGGTGEGSFNERFARPNHLGAFTGTVFPIQYQTTTDAVTG